MKKQILGFAMKKQISVRVEEETLNKLKKELGTNDTSKVVNYALTTLEAHPELCTHEIKTIIPYMGKKCGEIANTVKELFDASDCDVFIDLFCGSLGMLAVLDNDTKVIINDKNGDLINLYQVIKKDINKFVSEITDLPCSLKLFKSYEEILKNRTWSDDLERAVAFYYVQFYSYMGRLNNRTFYVKTKGKSRAEEYRENMERIIALHYRLKTVTILNKDFKDVLKTYAIKPNIFIYCDPPYDGTEDTYICKDFDHKALSELLKGSKCKFTVSYKATTLIHKLYRSTKIFCCRFPATKKRTSKKNLEILLTNIDVISQSIKGDWKAYK